MTEKTITAYDDLEFAPLSEGNPVEAAFLWGNPETGPATFMVRIPAGYAEPFHSHTATYHAVLVKGDFQSRDPDNPDDATTYGPGAFMVQPGGGVHAEASAGEEVVALVRFDGPPDFVPAE